MKIEEKSDQKNNDLEYLINELTTNNNINSEEIIQKLEQDKTELKSLNYNLEKLNDRIKENNVELGKIRWRAGCIIFLLIIPYVLKLLYLIYQVNNLNELINLLYGY